MSRHALNFIVEGLQSPVPNHVVCEDGFLEETNLWEAERCAVVSL